MHSKESSTRVPTQITCKFLDSASVAWAEEGGGIIGVNRIPSTFVFRHLIATRENRGGIRCVRARIIGREIGLSTRCHKYRQQCPMLMNLKGFSEVSRQWSCLNLDQTAPNAPIRPSPIETCAFQLGVGVCLRPSCDLEQPPSRVIRRSNPPERHPDRSCDFHPTCSPRVPRP
jgi:hypothetical protein